MSVLFKAENGTEYRARLMTEFRYVIDPRLRAILLELAEWVRVKQEADITLTCLNRTITENEQVGGYKFSAHLSGRGADIRTWGFSVKQIEAIMTYLKESWGEEFIFVLYHGSGSSNHLHINIRWKHHIKNYV